MSKTYAHKGEVGAEMRSIIDGAKGRSLTDDERAELADLEKLSYTLPDAPNREFPDTRGVTGGLKADYREVQAARNREVRGYVGETLAADQSASEWLRAARANGVPGIARRGTDHDYERYWQERFGFAPRSVESRALNETTNADGGYIVPEEWATTFIDLLRPNLVLSDAQILMLPAAVHYLPTYTTDVAPVGVSENTAMSADGNPAFGTLEFSTLGYAYTDLVLVSRQLIEDTNQAGGLNALMESVIRQKYARLFESIALYGDSDAPNTPGLVGETGVQQFAGEGSSLADFDDVSIAVEKVRTKNAEPTAIVMHPRTALAFDELKASTYAQYWRPNPDVAHLWPPRLTTAVSITETVTSGVVSAETGSGTTSSMYVGDFRRMILGFRTELVIDILKERYADQNSIGIRSYVRFCPRVSHPETFAWANGYTAPS